MVILDTSVVIDHLRRPPKQSYLYKLRKRILKETFALSIVSVQELYEGQSTKVEQKEQTMLATIGPLKIVSYTYDVAQLAGEIARDLRRPIDFADAAIAASAIINGAQLATLNKKDFMGIGDLELLD